MKTDHKMAPTPTRFFLKTDGDHTKMTPPPPHLPFSLSPSLPSSLSVHNPPVCRRSREPLSVACERKRKPASRPGDDDDYGVHWSTGDNKTGIVKPAALPVVRAQTTAKIRRRKPL